jgi:hypothetical protein
MRVSSWRTFDRHQRRVLAALLVPSLLLPVLGLVHRGLFVRGDHADEEPMSWQMYSLVTDPVRYEIHTEDDGVEVVDVDDLVGVIERRMNYGDHLFEVVCGAHPEAVEVVRIGVETRETYSC